MDELKCINYSNIKFATQESKMGDSEDLYRQHSKGCGWSSSTRTQRDNESVFLLITRSEAQRETNLKRWGQMTRKKIVTDVNSTRNNISWARRTQIRASYDSAFPISQVKDVIRILTIAMVLVFTFLPKGEAAFGRNISFFNKPCIQGSLKICNKNRFLLFCLYICNLLDDNVEFLRSKSFLSKYSQ